MVGTFCSPATLKAPIALSSTEACSYTAIRSAWRNVEKFLEKLGIHCHERDLVRGALLHDYFLYDWHDKYSHEKLHGFHHPHVALENASREYQLTPRERDIIQKHMWPLTLFHIPRCREAWVVTTADKYCSLKETLLERKGRNKNRKKSENHDAKDTG